MMRKFRLIYLLAPSVYLVITYLSLSPNHYKSPIDMGFIPVDKVVHFAMYFILTLASLFEMSRLGKIKSPKSIFLWACMIPVLYSGLIEIVQEYCTTDRSGDWFDFATNCTGVTIAYLFFRILSVRLSWISPDRSPSPDRDRESR